MARRLAKRHAYRMEWYWWLLGGVGSVMVVIVVAGVALWRNSRGRAFLKLSTRAKLRFGRLLLRSGRLPWLAKAVVLGLIGYLALPFDLIPDFIPVLGQLDDVAVVAVALLLLIRLTPRDVFMRALDEAARPDAGAQAAGSGKLLL